MSTLRRFAAVLCIAVFAAVTAVPAFAATDIKIGTVVWIGYGPFYVADALDLYKKSGYKVTLQVFSDPALIPPAIEGGSGGWRPPHLRSGDRRGSQGQHRSAW